jgi:hypothetical protein
MDRELISNLDPKEVLFDYDGPRLFTARTARGDLLLVYWCGEADGRDRFLAVPANDDGIARLKASSVSLRESLDQPWAWLVERARTGEIVQVDSVNVGSLPESALPRTGTTLVAKPPVSNPIKALGAWEAMLRDGLTEDIAVVAARSNKRRALWPDTVTLPSFTIDTNGVKLGNNETRAQ